MARSKIHDGAVVSALREWRYGPRSASRLARELSKKLNRSIHREHMHAYEAGRRRMSDPLIEAIAEIFDVPTTLFPEYTARHVTPDIMRHPLMAWAFLKTTQGKMSHEDGEKLVRRTEHIKGDFHPVIVDMLLANGVRTVELPRLKAPTGGRRAPIAAA